MGEKRDRDVEKVYSTSEFVAKLRRLADALEAGERFEIRVAGERVYVPARAAQASNHPLHPWHRISYAIHPSAWKMCRKKFARYPPLQEPSTSRASFATLE